MKMLLFDVDGTLILTGGAGMRAMNRAFATIFGIPDALEGLTLSGMTDKRIFRDACTKFGIECSDGNQERFKASYVTYLQEEIDRRGSGKRIMPGIVELLQALQEHDDIKLGLLTGNYADGAKIKLGHFDLARYFRFGAFGDDDEDRNRLLPFAVERCHTTDGWNGRPDAIWVIGDTPRDVECARPHGARAIAVATGDYDLAALERAKPDVLLPDLSDNAAVLRLLRS